MKNTFLFLLLFLVLLSACSSSESSKAKYLTRAKEYISEKNWPKARVALRNVLKIDPKDAEGYFLRAEVAEKEGDMRTAFTSYLKLLELDPGHQEAMIRLGQFYLAGGALDKVTEMSDGVLKLASHNRQAPLSEQYRGLLLCSGSGIYDGHEKDRKALNNADS